MRAPLLTWAARVALLAVGVTAPAAGYWLRSRETGNAETALEGLGSGFVITVLVAIALSLTLKTNGIRRLGSVVAFLMAVVVSWVSAIDFLRWFHA